MKVKKNDVWMCNHSGTLITVKRKYKNLSILDNNKGLVFVKDEDDLSLTYRLVERDGQPVSLVDKLGLDVKKPIYQYHSEFKKIYMLLPQIDRDICYNIVGYNWFNITDMRYNSCCFFESIDEALKTYLHTSDVFSNNLADLEALK